MLKKTPGVLRTVFDLRQQNENTVKDVTPFLDQDTIQHDMARAKYRLKLHLTEVYEQIRIELKDVPKTAFSTIVGMFISNVLQIGNTNVLGYGLKGEEYLVNLFEFLLEVLNKRTPQLLQKKLLYICYLNKRTTGCLIIQ
jgi:chromatin segregation and condensation protein Rec8/ScpA/Scc1 (kleisin family)